MTLLTAMKLRQVCPLDHLDPVLKQRTTDMIITTHAGDRFNLIDTLTNSSAWDSRTSAPQRTSAS